MRFLFFFSSRRRHTRWNCDWSSDVCSSDLGAALTGQTGQVVRIPAKSAAKVRIGLPQHAGGGVKIVAIVVTPLPGSGPVYAARLAIVGGSLLAVLPVVSSPTRIDLPDVGQSLVRVLGSLAGPSAPAR